MKGPRVGVYPGTFDPIHHGHLDVIRRATRFFDRLVIAVAINAGKDPLFGLDDRRHLAEVAVADLAANQRTNGAELEVRAFDTLLVDLAHEVGATIIVRGLRAVSDFEYEFQMASNNARLSPDIETVFLTASETNQFISSRFVKEIALLGGDVSSFVPASVLAAVDGVVARRRPG